MKKSVVGIGAAPFTDISGKLGDSVEIVVARDENGPIETKKVPQSWYRQVRNTRRVVEKSREQFEKKSGVRGVKIGSSTEKFGGKSGHSIVISVNETGVRGKIPERVQNVPVEIVEEEGGSAPLNCDNLGDFNNIPGGVAHGFDFATTCVKVRDIQAGQRRMLTAAHVHGSCGSNLSGNTFYQGDSDGTIRRYDWGTDFALVEDTYSDGESFDDKILEEDGTRIDIDGWYTKDGISELMSNDEQVKKMGITSGNTTGEIKYMETAGDPTDCHDYGYEGVRLTNNGGKGDSGGPIYNMKSQEARMIGMISQGAGNQVDSVDCDNNGISSPIFEKIEGPSFYHMWNSFSFFPKS